MRQRRQREKEIEPFQKENIQSAFQAMKIPILDIVLQANNVQHCWLWHMEKIKKKKKSFCNSAPLTKGMTRSQSSTSEENAIFHRYNLTAFSYYCSCITMLCAHAAEVCHIFLQNMNFQVLHQWQPCKLQLVNIPAISMQGAQWTKCRSSLHSSPKITLLFCVAYATTPWQPIQGRW